MQLYHQREAARLLEMMLTRVLHVQKQDAAPLISRKRETKKKWNFFLFKYKTVRNNGSINTTNCLKKKVHVLRQTRLNLSMSNKFSEKSWEQNFQS